MDFEDDEIDERGTDWNEFFSCCASSWLNNATMREGWKFKKPYAYVISKGYSQSDVVQIIYDTTEIPNNAKAGFDEFFWQSYVDLEIKIDGEYYDQYDILGDDLEFYHKDKVIEGVKKIMGNEFNDDIKNQLE
jgi:beta-glucosidase-like glycosyl hydrolase